MPQPPILSERGTHVGDCPGGHIKACQSIQTPWYTCEPLHRIGKSHSKTWKKLLWNTGIPHFQKLGDDKDSRVTWHNMMMQSSGYQLCSKGSGHRLKPRSSLTNRNCCSKPNCMKTSGTYKFPIKPSNVQSSEDRGKKIHNDSLIHKGNCPAWNPRIVKPHVPSQHSDESCERKPWRFRRRGRRLDATWATSSQLTRHHPLMTRKMRGNLPKNMESMNHL